MFTLFRKERIVNTNFFLVLDIGSYIIKSLVCEIGEGTCLIRGVGKVPQSSAAMQNGSVMDIGSVIESAARAIEEASSQAQGHPTDVIMGIAGELVKGITKTTTYVRKEPHTKIDLQELKQIIHKVQWKSFEETRNQLAYETGFPEIEIKLVNAAIVDVCIDGYRIANPIGFQGKEVTISIFNSFAPLVHFGALQTIAAELGLNLKATVAEPFALARCLERDDPHATNGIFIDVGGATTEIAVVHDGALAGTKMFTLGGRTFSKRLASTLNISLEEAEEIKRAYCLGRLEKQSEKVVKEAMESDAEVWLAGVTLSLSEFTNLDMLPEALYLCGGGCHLPEVKNALAQSQWTQDLPFSKPPTVSLLSPFQVTKVKDMTRKMTESGDVMPLALARLGFEYIGPEPLMSTLLHKVIRLMQI